MALDFKKGHHATSVRRQLLDGELEANLAAEIKSNYRRLISEAPGPVAVRSSATAEDLEKHSFAGLYETVLNVSDERSLLEAVRRCWASYWHEEAFAYRARAHMDHRAHLMSVLVQHMIQPRQAGVLYTNASPFDSDSVMAVEFVNGHAEALASGRAVGERLLMDRNTGKITPPRPPGHMGTQEFYRLMDLGESIEAQQGVAQDIEWCLDANDRLWVVQARAVTTSLPGGQVRNPTQPSEGWNCDYDEPFSPLGCDLAERRHHVWVSAINDYYKTNSPLKLQFVDGLLHYKPTWRAAGIHGFWKRGVGFWKWLQAESIHRNYIEILLPEYERCLRNLIEIAFTDLDRETLLRNFNASIGIYLNLQRSSYPLVEIAKTSSRILELLCGLWFGNRRDLRVDRFLTGLGSITVTRDLELYRLGREMRNILGRDCARTLDSNRIEWIKDIAPELGVRLQDFFDTYGYIWADRYPRDPAWHVDWEAVVASFDRVISTSEDHGLPRKHELQKQQRSQTIQQALLHLSPGPLSSLRKRIFKRLLKKAETYFPHKENRNHHVYQTVAVIGAYAREIGRRLEHARVLPQKEDVFFLSWDEIQILSSIGQHDSRLIAKLEERKAHFAHARAYSRASPVTKKHEGQFTGDPCSAGIALGPARIVKSLGDLHKVRRGDVLVCRSMRPAWSTVFARASGAVVEIGGLLSHGATLAREYGVPAVMNIPGIMGAIRDGDRLSIDGNAGIITVQETNKNSSRPI